MNMANAKLDSKNTHKNSHSVVQFYSYTVRFRCFKLPTSAQTAVIKDLSLFSLYHGRPQAWERGGGPLPPGNVVKCFVH